MKILFFSRLFYPHIGGVEKHVLEISKLLIKKGHKVTVITEELPRKKNPRRENIDSIEIYRIPVGSNNRFRKFRIWRELWKLRKLIKISDIIHCHDVFFWYLPFRFLYSKKPVYTAFHGYETKFPPSKKAIFIRKISEKLSWGNICVGDYVKKWYGTKADFVTYGGVDLKSQISKLPTSSRSAGLRRASKTQKYKSKFKIVFIGRLEEDTGVLIYLKALELMRQKKTEFEFEACGNGSLREEVERYGKVYRFVKCLDQYIQKADVVFASSYLSILEAMKHKKLVFCVYDNSLKEDYLRMSPFSKRIIIESSPKDLADKILYFIKHQDEKEKIANTAYEWVKMQTWDNVTSMYVNLWHIPLRHSYTDTGSVQIRRSGKSI